MTVWELIQALALCQPGDKVAIPIVTSYTTVGRSPSEQIASVTKGFDWNDGMVYLNIGEDKQLTPMSREEYTSHIRYKSLVGSLRGREDVAHLSDVYVKKDFVIERLTRMINVEELEPFEVSDLITDIQEEKL